MDKVFLQITLEESSLIYYVTTHKINPLVLFRTKFSSKLGIFSKLLLDES